MSLERAGMGLGDLDIGRDAFDAWDGPAGGELFNLRVGDVEFGLSERNLIVVKVVNDIRRSQESVAKEDWVIACGIDAEAAGFSSAVEGGCASVSCQKRLDKLGEGDVDGWAAFSTERKDEGCLFLADFAGNDITEGVVSGHPYALQNGIGEVIWEIGVGGARVEDGWHSNIVPGELLIPGIVHHTEAGEGDGERGQAARIGIVSVQGGQ